MSPLSCYPLSWAPPNDTALAFFYSHPREGKGHVGRASQPDLDDRFRSSPPLGFSTVCTVAADTSNAPSRGIECRGRLGHAAADDGSERTASPAPTADPYRSSGKGERTARFTIPRRRPAAARTPPAKRSHPVSGNAAPAR